MRGAVAAVVVIAAILAVAGLVWWRSESGGGAKSSGRPKGGTSICGESVGRQPREYRHIVWVVLENESYDDVIGNAQAPFLNELAASCGLATNYFAVAHPSLPNYVALTSGSTGGIADDELPAAHPLPGPSLFSQLGTDWTAVLESMPTPCSRKDDGLYAARHNPPAYFVELRSTCARQERAGPVDATSRFTLVVPNLCHDGHDCPTAKVDQWLEHKLRPLLGSSTYRSGGTAVFIVWDENDGSGPNHVPLLVVSPYTPAGARSAKRFDHFGLLRTTESMLRLPCLAAACRATSLRDAFGL